jgi:hypothetical protein
LNLGKVRSEDVCFGSARIIAYAEIWEMQPQSCMALRATQDHKDSAVPAKPNLKGLVESLGQMLRCAQHDNAFRFDWSGRPSNRKPLFD